ncbi:hypothetical protein EDD66_103112 [Mobilisporobacter senegalensis]|uniref:Uncharacterized protein n=1 Tax=Mobilisporobacter senegalensis TaxID=1329262 RepID=A0A3N1XW64_9FIRM|nr:hypothetical protein [Mobilisporobacter senegalensis]ROR29177.1 hypothetical protein EDD66_103112 [Mobilisporobacter senegalensis]
MGNTSEDTIVIKTEDLEEQLIILKNSIEQIRPYNETYLKKIITDIENMNSDFISKIEKVLSNMTDTKAPALMNKLDTYVNYVETTVKTFHGTDTTIADVINKDEE